MNSVVIVGSSVGGVRTAQALRGEGFDGRVVLIGAERHLPYDKPPLSKEFLTGKSSESSILLLSEQAAAESGIELRLGIAATRLDVASHELHLADGDRLSYENLVIATGASARPSPWRPESGVHVLRSLEDSIELRDAFLRDGPVVVVGGGFIGAEVAGAALQLGREVTIVDPLPTPIARVVGAALGENLVELHRRHGVTCHLGTGVEEITGSAGDLRLQLTDGTELHAATVVVGIGAVPNDQWLEDSGLAIENGVLCDEYSRAVDAPGVFAVGDVARWFHPVRREHVRVEHWTNAVDQAACVAHNIAQPDDLRAYSPTEYVWSDQYDWKIQIVGRPTAGVEHELIGSLDGALARGAMLYTDPAGELCGAVTINWPKALVRCRRMVGASAEAAREQIRALATR